VIGDGAALAEAVFIGTHTGEFAGIPATGLQVRLAYCMVYDVADGAITALRAYFPQGALAAQLTEAAAAAAAVPAQERRSPRPAETGAQRR
jgi:predicted ester cyclase